MFEVHGPETGLPGYAVLPVDYRELSSAVRAKDAQPEDLLAGIVALGELIWKLASRSLAALSVTEAVEIEIVDAPIEKRDYKRAVKRGWPIAKQIVIRSRSRRYRDGGSESGQKANYSHRFWRRATVAHYPLGTRMADARPDLVTPCKRLPESNCGFCRKVKHPPCIVGPEDKPLVLKTLVRRK